MTYQGPLAVPAPNYTLRGGKVQPWLSTARHFNAGQGAFWRHNRLSAIRRARARVRMAPSTLRIVAASTALHLHRPHRRRLWSPPRIVASGRNYSVPQGIAIAELGAFDLDRHGGHVTVSAKLNRMHSCRNVPELFRKAHVSFMTTFRSF